MIKRLYEVASETARVGLAIMICFILCSPSIYVTKTTAGLHCPTSSIQKIKDLEGELRTPKIGDSEFMQCQCAEKKSAKQKSELENISTASLIPPFLIGTPLLSLSFPINFKLSNIPSFDLIKVKDSIRPPLTNPPQVA